MGTIRGVGVAALCLVSAACGSGPGSPASGTYALTRVGSGDLVLHPGDKRTLQVMLAQDQAGPVPDASVHFEFKDGDPAGAVLDAPDVKTDASGVAAVRFTAGGSAAASPRYKLVATAPGRQTDPVTFSFDVIPVRHLLEIVGSAVTHVSAGGASASTFVTANHGVDLRVRELDADTGAPVAGDPILFTLASPGDLSWSSSGASTLVQTGAGGEATESLLAHAAAGGPWVVTARSAAGPGVTFNVTVQPASGAPPDTCDPGAPVCLSGIWKTKHDFNIREALPTALQDVFHAIRVVDQAILGKLTIPSLPSWLQEIINSFVSRLLQQYMPAWLEQVIHLSDAVVTMVSNLRSEGTLRLVQGADARHFQGTEVWTSLVFYYLPLCDGNIGGDPTQPPECARIDVFTSDAKAPGEVAQCKGQSLPSVAVQVAPFTAELTGTGAPYGVQVTTPRQVRLEMGQVLLALLDQILGSVTPYHCVDEITECRPGAGNCPLVDCYGLSQDLAGPGTLVSGFIDAASVERLCDGGATLAGQEATSLLANAWTPSADLLDFTGKATVTDANTLGSGTWSGDFFFKLLHELPARWEASRAP